MKIRFLQTVSGSGNAGDVLDVSDSRAARWVGNGWCEYANDAPAETPEPDAAPDGADTNDAPVEPDAPPADEPEPATGKRGRR